ncbi:4'-phosphopantetheinyl transferase superfamily protein [Luteimonas yindakuii]|uniref:4'-phosphopantetheinyl transferase family protein n=1 Tax=Luteimonas yindakuii TaxID=2565782 RepID=UPI0010A38292|nr:4'-phosphopantetheinyl transferase superfamily protein [Luteimonas yindakuii]QCO68590.1 4'-phosphopantetheinyl transferase superfamily protein [Luteimonas yindakuii]
MRTQTPARDPDAPLSAGALRLGTIDCAWRPYTRGDRAEPQVRAWLADLLPGDVPALERDIHGRPRWPDAIGAEVSWSHSGGGLLMALARGLRVGCDLEWMRPRMHGLELARRFFHPREAAWLESLPVPVRERVFVRLWCAKEAVLKAHGRGIAFGLHRLEFAERGDALALVDCDAALGRPQDWSLHAFEPAPGYLATLAWSPLPPAGGDLQ